MKLPANSQLWQQLLGANGIPNSLPEPIALPRQLKLDVDGPFQTTTSPVHYLLTAYLMWLQPFEQHMTRQRQAMLQRQAAASAVAVRPPPISNGIPQTIHAASPAAMADSNAATLSAAAKSTISVSSPQPVASHAEAHSLQAKAVPPLPKKSKITDTSSKSLPAPINADVSADPSSSSTDTHGTPALGTGKKRKRDKLSK